jgi:Zn-finger nucleic acid-binding protein
MNCPKDQHPFKPDQVGHVAVNRCTACASIWLEYPALDRLENEVFPEEDLKGTLIYNEVSSDLKCPVCGEQMQTFDYRGWNLQIQVCPKLHGFFLDNGEENKVLQLMKQRFNALERDEVVEDKWASQLRRMGAPDFLTRLRELFRP